MMKKQVSVHWKIYRKKIGNDEYRRFEIFGVFNPISISLKEIQKIGNNLEQFEKYLHEIQAWTYIMRLQMFIGLRKKN